MRNRQKVESKKKKKTHTFAVLFLLNCVFGCVQPAFPANTANKIIMWTHLFAINDSSFLSFFFNVLLLYRWMAQNAN